MCGVGGGGEFCILHEKKKSPSLFHFKEQFLIVKPAFALANTRNVWLSQFCQGIEAASGSKFLVECNLCNSRST